MNWPLKLRVLWIFLISLLVGTVLILPALTQNDGGDTCDIDLSQVAMLLIQAQDAAGAGDTTMALNILAEAEAQISALRDACGGALGRFTTFTTPDDAFRFNYPSSWVFNAENRNTFIMGTSEDAIELFFQADPTFPSGLQAAGVLIGDARQVGGARGDDLSAILDAYEADLAELDYAIISREPLEINGQPAERLNFNGDGFESAIISLQLASEDTFAVIVASTAPDEFAALEPIILDIVGSIDAAPVPPPEPISLEQTFTFEDDVMTFDYPGGWVLGDAENNRDGSTVILANSNSVLNLLDNSDIPTFRIGQQLMLVGVGEASLIAGVDDDTTDVDTIVVGIAESLVPGIDMSSVTRLNYNRRNAAEFTLSLPMLDVTIHVIEMRPRSTFAILLILGAPDNSEQNARLVRAVAASIRFPSSAEPLGAPAMAQALVAQPTPTATPEIIVQDLTELGTTQTIGAFTFDYPEDWLLGTSTAEDDPTTTSTTVGTSMDAINKLDQEAPTFEAGEQAVGIITGLATDLNVDMADESPAALLNVIINDALEDTDYTFTDVQNVLINDMNSAQVTFTGETFTGSVIVIVPTPGVYALLIGGGAPDEGEALYAVARAMAESVTFTMPEFTPPTEDNLPTLIPTATATPGN